MELCERLTEQRGTGIHAVFQQSDRTTRELLGVDRTGNRDHPFDIFCELRFRPDHAMDPKQFEALHGGCSQEIFARYEAHRLRRSKLLGHSTGHDIDFVETGAGDEDIRTCDAGSANHVGRGSAPEHELDVELLESISGFLRVIDDDDLVTPGEGA